MTLPARRQQVTTRRSKQVKELPNEWAHIARDEKKEMGHHETSSRIAHSPRLFWGVGLFVIGIGYGLRHMSMLVLLIITGVIVAFALERFIRFWQHVGCSRGLAIAVAYTLLIAFMLSGMVILVPFLITQLVAIGQLILDGIQTIQTNITTLGRTGFLAASHLPAFLKQRLIANSSDGSLFLSLQSGLNVHISQLITFGGSGLKTAGNAAFGLANRLLRAGIQLVLVMTVAVFVSVERTVLLGFLTRCFPTNHNRHALMRLSEKLGQWLEGQLLLCIIIGLMSAVGLYVLAWIGVDLPQKFSLAMIAGLTEFIPYVGPMLGAVPALLVAGLSFGRKGLVATALLYRLIQALEGNFIVPTVMSQKLGVSPLLIFLCMLTAASLFGFLGVLLAVPCAVILDIIFGGHRSS